MPIKKKRTKSKQNFSSDFACARGGMSQLPPSRFENKTLHSRNPHGVVVITAKRWRELSYVCVNLGEWYQLPPFNNNNTIINTIAWLAHGSGDELKTPIKRVRCRYLLKYPPTHLPNMNVCYRGTKVRRHIKDENNRREMLLRRVKSVSTGDSEDCCGERKRTYIGTFVLFLVLPVLYKHVVFIEISAYVSKPLVQFKKEKCHSII